MKLNISENSDSRNYVDNSKIIKAELSTLCQEYGFTLKQFRVSFVAGSIFTDFKATDDLSVSIKSVDMVHGCRLKLSNASGIDVFNGEKALNGMNNGYKLMSEIYDKYPGLFM